MRRCHRSASALSTGWPNRPARASSRSTRCTPFPTASPTTPARICRTRSSIAIRFIWISKRWTISRAAPAPRRCSSRDTTQREIGRLRDSQFVEYERVYRLKLRFLKLLFRTFLETEWKRKTSARRRTCRIHRTRGRAAATGSRCIPRSKRRFTPNTRTCGTGERGRTSIRTRNRPRRRRSRSNTGAAFCFTSICSGSSTGNSTRHSSTRASAALSIGLYHDLALATDRFGSDLWAHRGFFVAGCRVGAPPDAFSPKGQDWAFPPPNSERALRRRLPACSPSPSARTAGTAARCASIT